MAVEIVVSLFVVIVRVKAERIPNSEMSKFGLLQKILTQFT